MTEKRLYSDDAIIGGGLSLLTSCAYCEILWGSSSKHLLLWNDLND